MTGESNVALEQYFEEKRSPDLEASTKRVLVALGIHHGAINAFNEG